MQYKVKIKLSKILTIANLFKFKIILANDANINIDPSSKYLNICYLLA